MLLITYKALNKLAPPSPATPQPPSPWLLHARSTHSQWWASDVPLTMGRHRVSIDHPHHHHHHHLQGALPLTPLSLPSGWSGRRLQDIYFSIARPPSRNKAAALWLLTGRKESLTATWGAHPSPRMTRLGGLELEVSARGVVSCMSVCVCVWRGV